MVAVVVTPSGWNHLKDPEARSKSIEMSRGFTMFLGVSEVAGGVALVLGVLTQLAALGLILLLLGAIYKKIFTWHIGFFGEDGYGWDYESMLIVMNLVIIATNGGRLVLMPWSPFGH